MQLYTGSPNLVIRLITSLPAGGPTSEGCCERWGQKTPHPTTHSLRSSVLFPSLCNVIYCQRSPWQKAKLIHKGFGPLLNSHCSNLLWPQWGHQSHEFALAWLFLNELSVSCKTGHAYPHWNVTRPSSAWRSHASHWHFVPPCTFLEVRAHFINNFECVSRDLTYAAFWARFSFNINITLFFTS